MRRSPDAQPNQRRKYPVAITSVAGRLRVSPSCRRRLPAAAAVGVWLILALLPATAGAFTFEQAIADRKLRGPEGAPVALIWSHGKSLERDESKNPPPWLVLLLAADGFDVFRLQRRPSEDTLSDSSDALDHEVDRLHAEGYRRIVLGGQSYGAWISLMVAARNPLVSAVIANAPAAYGTRKRRGYERNATKLYRLLEELTMERVMLSFFEGDDYDPGDRAANAEEILSRHGVPHLVLDDPKGFVGHASGNSGRFARRFGRCVEAVLSPGPMPLLAACDSGWGERPSGQLTWPAATTVAPATGSAAPYAGEWWGTCDNGRETMLVVEASTENWVDAAYGIGATVDRRKPASFAQRRGHFDDDDLVFDEPGRSSIVYRIEGKGMLAEVWRPAPGVPGSRLDCRLRRWPTSAAG